MKFNNFLNVFVVLATTSSVYGASGIQDLTNCESQLENYKACTAPITLLSADQVKERCSEKCEFFFSDPKKAVSSCYEAGVESLFPDLIEFEIRKNAQDLLCSSCPIADFYLDPSIRGDSLMKLVKKNCQSSKCSETFKNYLPSFIKGLKMNKLNDLVEEFTEIQNYIESDKCENNNKPITTTIKTTTTTTIKRTTTTTTTSDVPVPTTTTSDVPIQNTTTISDVPVKATITSEVSAKTTVTIPTSGTVATPKPSKPRRKCIVKKKN